MYLNFDMNCQPSLKGKNMTTTYQEKNVNFDEVIDRRHTECLKYDFADRRGMPQDVLPLWVADMDFKTSSIVLEILKERVEHGIFGYTETREEYFDAVSSWLKNHHNFIVEEKWLVKTPGVVVALAASVKAFTNKGDAVLIQQPVYYPFAEVISDNGRRVVSSDLVVSDDGSWSIDFADFERKIRDEHIHLFILCSPHNPVGRVWTKDELLRLAQICERYDVVVVSDEIHHDFVYGERKHQVFAALNSRIANYTITCTSPGKTFNLAGLQVSNIFISNPRLRKLFKNEIKAMGYSQLGTMGITACRAAYAYGDQWYQAVLNYINANIDFVESFVKEQLPQIKFKRPEGTYLVWLDFRGVGLTDKELHRLLEHKAKLWVDHGSIFGTIGQGFERINVACPRSVVRNALERIKVALSQP